MIFRAYVIIGLYGIIQKDFYKFYNDFGDIVSHDYIK